MTTRAATPLFIDTGAFIAWYDGDDEHHQRATAVFQGIRSGDPPYRPLYTSRYVLSELSTRLQRAPNVGHSGAVDALHTIRGSSGFNILRLQDGAFDRTCDQFARYDDRQISFVDHTSGVLAADHDIDRIFTFDPDDFRTLGFTAVPDDTGDTGEA